MRLVRMIFIHIGREWQLRSFFIEVKKRIIEDEVFDLAAQLAYFFLMSLFPFLLLTVTLLGYLPFSSEDIFNLVKHVAPPDTYEMIQNNLSVILDGNKGGVLSFSLITTLYLASVAFRSIIHIMDDAYRVEEDRSLWIETLLGLFLMFGLLVAIILSLFLSLFGKVVGEWVFEIVGVGHWFTEIWYWMRWAISSFFIFFALLSLYKFAPNTKISFRQALPGAIFATVGWQIFSLVFSYYVSFTNYNLIYGNLGAMMVLVGWFYLSALVLILGGQMNAILCTLQKREQRK